MAAQYKENWKRLTGQLPTSEAATEDADLARKVDVPSGGTNYVLVANGLLANDEDAGTVYTAVVGRRYVLAAYNPSSSSPIFQSGDEDLATLLAIVKGTPSILDTMSVAAKGVNSSSIVFIESLASSNTLVDVTASDSDGADTTALRLLRNGAITAKHTQVLNNTNGIYLVWELQ